MGSVNSTRPNPKQPLFSFGVITDVQHADIPDGRSFVGVPRYYRHSLLVLQRAVRHWNRGAHDFAINLGDIVDGFCPRDRSSETVRLVATEFDKFRPGPVRHLIGNHCLYNLPRRDLLPALNMDAAYYEFSPSPEFRFVILDGYDVSAIGWPPGHPRASEAEKLLELRNPNREKNSPEGLVGMERRFLKFNGGVGRDQLRWLGRVLGEAAELGQKVVVCCHLPMDPGASSVEALLWNYEEVMGVIHGFDCVKVCLAGHDHTGGHSVDSRGIHHRVLEAAVECPPGTDAFGYVEVYSDRLSLVGTGRMQSTEMRFGS